MPRNPETTETGLAAAIAANPVAASPPSQTSASGAISQPSGGKPSRAEGYLARVDAHLADMNRRERKDWLERQIITWEKLFCAFIATEGRSQPVTDPNDPPRAEDFALTLAGLALRHARA